MPHLPVNGLDLAVGIILLVSALLAFMRGFVHEILSIGAWIGAVAGSLYGLKYVQPTARRLIPLDWAADAAASVVLFLVVLFALSLVTNMASRSIQKSALNALDRSLGFVFGLVRAAVILAVCLIISEWLMVADQRPLWMTQAKTLPLIEDGAGVLKSLLPGSFRMANDAAKDAAGKVSEAVRLKSTLDRLTNPVPAGAKPANGAGAGKTGGYEDKARQDMEQLIQSTEPAEAPAAADQAAPAGSRP